MQLFLKILSGKANSVDPDQWRSSLISLIRVYTVCICHFVRHFGVQNFRIFTVPTVSSPLDLFHSSLCEKMLEATKVWHIIFVLSTFRHILLGSNMRKTNFQTFMPSEELDQLPHVHSWSVFAILVREFSIIDCRHLKTEQIPWVCKLIWVSAGSTCMEAQFLTLWLILMIK